MANKNLFASAIAKLLPAADTANHEGASAYAYGPEVKLAQLAATGTLADNFYGTAQIQLTEVLEAARNVDPLFVAKVRDIVGLYLDPPERAMVLCVDEKTQIQALNRTAPVFPMLPGTPARATHDYVRHGTSSCTPP